MRSWWLASLFLTLVVLALALAPLRWMRRAQARPEAPPAAPVGRIAAAAIESRPPAGSALPTAAASPALLLDIGPDGHENDGHDGEEHDGDAQDEMQVSSTQPALSPAEQEAARRSLEAAMRTALPEIGGCYRQALERDPALRGQLTVQITLAPQPGSDWALIEQAIIDDNKLQAPLLEQCILAAIAKLRVAKPRDRLYVDYPLNLKPGQAGQASEESDSAGHYVDDAVDHDPVADDDSSEDEESDGEEA